jgi:phosphoribosylamine--glycine ligase
MGKKVLILGGGGREHALAEAFSASTEVSEILCAPGNAGTAQTSKCRNIAAVGVSEIADMAREERVDLVVPGSEIFLAEGVVDVLERANIPAFGPPMESARLEASKSFAKDFMKRNGVATAQYEVCRDPGEALSAVDRIGCPVVVKADGLAAGKGVIVCPDREAAVDAIRTVMEEKAFGRAGDEVVVEECLFGWETSLIGIVDGMRFLPFLPARDHKPAGEGDRGPNTGGMGVVAPHPLVDEAVMRDIESGIVEPTLRGLHAEGLGYAGFLFFGIMVTTKGARALEYNVRFGDPEAQALLPLLETDLLELAEAALSGGLDDRTLYWRGGASCCVVVASPGYPGAYPKGEEIRGLDGVYSSHGARVFLAGAALENGKVVTTGGRVLGVTGIGGNLESARLRAYAAVEKIEFPGAWCRSDIGAQKKTIG